MLASRGIPSTTFSPERAIDSAHWAALDATMRDKSIGLQQQIRVDFARVDAASAMSATTETTGLALVETPPA